MMAANRQDAQDAKIADPSSSWHPGRLSGFIPDPDEQLCFVILSKGRSLRSGSLIPMQ
jgi:hypothetical protein